ncbi:hypothetical protein N7490_004098 [Penicillium lividum]|nr:hypothetical protein N7490_004098 [Penicillium lividum]
MSTWSWAGLFFKRLIYGVHWSQAYWFLSQAPGPDDNFIKNVVNIEPTTATIDGTDNSWEDTLAFYWTALPSSVAADNSETNSSSSLANSSTASANSTSSLSTGAKAGIGIGCACAASNIIVLLAWFCVRRRQQAKLSDAQSPQQRSKVHTVQQGGIPVEIAGSRRETRHELDCDPGFAGYYEKRTSDHTSTTQGPQISARESEGPISDAHGSYELSH